MAIKSILEKPGDTNGNIIFTAVVDEESSSKGARHLASSGIIKADYGIVGEPTQSRVYLCHNGSIRPIISIMGRTAHASTPELGISAVRVASYISNKVDAMQENLRTTRHPAGGNPSMAITIMRAGVKENVLPDTCELTIDRRMVPGEDEAEIKTGFEELCRDAEKAFPGAKVAVDHYLVTTGPASEVKPESEIVQTAYAACERVTGIKQSPAGMICNTDMNHFIRLGIPCVIIGPGTMDVAHMPNEWVELSQLQTVVAVYEAVIRALLA
jgi:acetylornithine deacetylase/succinyl-diaminopimelate desuccinylase-like protein